MHEEKIQNICPDLPNQTETPTWKCNNDIQTLPSVAEPNGINQIADEHQEDKSGAEQEIEAMHDENQGDSDENVFSVSEKEKVITQINSEQEIVEEKSTCLQEYQIVDEGGLPKLVKHAQLPCLANHTFDEVREYFKKAIQEIEEEVFQKIGIRIKDINLEHAFEGHIEYGKLTGFHSTNLHPKKTLKVIIPPGHRGTFLAQWGENGLAKTSTFLPLPWNVEKTSTKIIEALKHIDQVDQSTKNGVWIVGITKENIPIEMFINKKGIIETAYPAYKYKGQLWIP